MTLKEFIKSKTFLKHLLLIIGSFLALIFIVMLMLKLYTRHGKEYKVPDITGKIYYDIEDSDEMSHFELMIMDSIYKDDVKSGTILNQDPPEGTMVKSGRKIYVTIACQNGQMVKMPSCRSKSLRAAVQGLVDSGLKVGNIMFRDGDVDGVVVEQRNRGKSIATGADIQTGERIDLVVEVNSTTKTVAVPDILGKSEYDAEILLWESGFNVGRKTFEGNCDKAHAKVISFSPASPRAVLGTTISLNFAADDGKYKSRMESFQDELNQEEEQQAEEGDDIIEVGGGEDEE